MVHNFLEIDSFSLIFRIFTILIYCLLSCPRINYQHSLNLKALKNHKSEIPNDYWLLMKLNQGIAARNLLQSKMQNFSKVSFLLINIQQLNLIGWNNKILEDIWPNNIFEIALCLRDFYSG